MNNKVKKRKHHHHWHRVEIFTEYDPWEMKKCGHELPWEELIDDVCCRCGSRRPLNNKVEG